MNMSMERKPVADRVRYSRMSGAELREAFVVGGLFTPGEVKLVHWEAERSIVGSAVPTGAPLRLEAPHQIKAEHFLDRRELGVANLGGAGSVTTDGTRHELAPRDLLYVGRGTRGVEFASADPSKPAFFYLVSHPAHASHPTTLAPAASAETVEIGDAAHASRRTLRRHIHARGVRSCQLVMGITDLASGSVWNTMPPHTHYRRTEIYLYFDLEPGAVVVHVMGPPDESRSLIVGDREAVLSPPWSMHFGAGTSRYAFVWSMGGENQEFEDMRGVAPTELR